METQLKLRSVIIKGGYKLEFGVNAKGLPTVRRYRMLASGINKGTYKFLEGYYFLNEEKRNAYAEGVIKKVQESLQAKEESKKAELAIRNNMEHGYKVGQILYDSWGYEQTNIDFYQIVEVAEKSIKIRAISGEMVSHDTGGDSGKVKPVADSFSGEVILKKVQFYLKDQKPVYYIKSKHGWVSTYERGENGVYCSWGY